MYSFSRSYGKLIELFCSHEIIFDNLEEIRKLLNDIHDESSVSSLEKLLLRSIMYKPLVEVRDHLKVMIAEVLEKTISELDESSGKKMEEFKDPITGKLITDPVTLNFTGDLYDRQTIINHLQKSDLDPVSGRKLKTRATSDSPYIRNKISEILVELTKNTISKVTDMMKFFKYYHSNIIIMGHFPVKIAEYEETSSHNCFPQIRKLMTIITSVLETVSTYLEHENLEILELRDFYGMYSYHCDFENTDREKQLRLLDIRRKIARIARSPEERIKVLEDRILLALPSEVVSRSVQTEINYKLLELHKNDPNAVFRIFPKLLSLIERSSEKKELIREYLRVYPDSQYLKLEFIPFMSGRHEKSKVYYDIAKLEFVKLRKKSYDRQSDLKIEEYLKKSIQHNIGFLASHELRFELYHYRCEVYVRRGEQPPRSLLERTGKQAMILADQQKPGDDMARMKYLEEAYQCIPMEPGLQEDLLQSYTSLGQFEKIYLLSKRHLKKSQSSPSSKKRGSSSSGKEDEEDELGTFKFFFTLIKNHRDQIDDLKKKNVDIMQEMQEMKRRDESRESEIDLLKRQVEELLLAQPLLNTSSQRASSSNTRKFVPPKKVQASKTTSSRGEEDRRKKNDNNMRSSPSSSTSTHRKNESATSRYDNNSSRRDGRRSGVRNYDDDDDDGSSRYTRGGREQSANTRRDTSNKRTSYDSGGRRRRIDEGKDDYDLEYERYSRSPRRDNDRRRVMRRDDDDDHGRRRRGSRPEDDDRQQQQRRSSSDDDNNRRRLEDRLPPRPRRNTPPPSHSTTIVVKKKEETPEKKKIVDSSDKSSKRTTTTTTTRPQNTKNKKEEEEEGRSAIPEKRRSVVKYPYPKVGSYRGENVFETTVIINNPNTETHSGLNRYQNFSPSFEAFGASWKFEVHLALRNLLTVKLKLLTENVKIFGVLTVVFNGKRVCSKDYDPPVIKEVENMDDTRSQWYDDEGESQVLVREKFRERQNRLVKDHWTYGVSDIGFQGAFTQPRDEKQWTFEIQIEKIREERLSNDEKKRVQEVVEIEKKYQDPVVQRMKSNEKEKEEEEDVKTTQKNKKKKRYDDLLNSELVDPSKAKKIDEIDDDDDEDQDILLEDDSSESDSDFFPQPKNKIDERLKGSSKSSSSSTVANHNKSFSSTYSTGPRMMNKKKEKGESNNSKSASSGYRYNKSRRRRQFYDDDDEYI